MAKFSDQNSDEWDRIKGFVGGAKPQAKHPIQQEMDRIDMRKPQHLDDGGMVDPLSQDSKNLLAPASMGGPSPFQAPPQMQPPPISAPIQRPSLPPIQQATPQLPPQDPAVSPAPDAAYNSQATQSLGGINPQELQAYLQKVNTSTPGQRFGSGLSGLADAFSRAGGSNSDYQKNFDTNQQQTRENLSRIPGAVSQQGKEQHGLAKDMAADDPTSMRSFIAQQSNKPLLKQSGFSDNDIKKIPASAIDGLRTGSLDIEKIRADYGLKKATIDQTGAYQQEVLGNTRKEIGVHQQEANTKNDEIRAAHPVQNALGLLGNSNSSGPQQISSQAQYNALPSGSQYLDHNGQARIKK